MSSIKVKFTSIEHPQRERIRTGFRNGKCGQNKRLKYNKWFTSMLDIISKLRQNIPRCRSKELHKATEVYIRSRADKIPTGRTHLYLCLQLCFYLY